MNIRELSSKAKLLEQINAELEKEHPTEKQLQLLQHYKEEFSEFLEEFISFYDNSVNQINTSVSSITSEKDNRINELQDTVNSLTKKLMEEKHAHELQMEHLSYIAYHEPEKAITFLSNLHIEGQKNKKFIS